MTKRKKLIEVALPLESINQEASREKSIRHGHPSTLHLWWARRPLAACRAVLFASLVDDPSSRPEEFPTEEAQRHERERLFEIIRELVKWENINNEHVLEAARGEILKSTDGNPPPVLDPFCGGGSIPLEAQRLGLKAYASDLNPVAVLITKALIEIPPRFANRAPVNPDYKRQSPETKALQGGEFKGAEGLAKDVRYYGKWMRDEAEKRIGHLYPKVQLPKEYGAGEATAIAWLWTRTVKCPNPACGATMPLVRSFWLCKKPKKKVWVEPIIDKEAKSVSFEVRTGKGAPPKGTVNRRGARCIVCGQPVKLDHVRAEGRAGSMGAQLMAIVAEGERGRLYLPPQDEYAEIAAEAQPTWKPEAELQGKATVSVPLYGMRTFGDLFTARQLVALNTFSDLIQEVRDLVLSDAMKAGSPDDGIPLDDGGAGGTAYADALATYLAFAVDKAADYWSGVCSWHSSGEFMRNTFGRQAIPMIWDYAECNPFSASTGNWMACIDWVWKVVRSSHCGVEGSVSQLDATAESLSANNSVVSTDPPYYDNICYGDLSDFFYVWLRRNLAKVYPGLFDTLLTPKTQELIASSYQFDGDRTKAEKHFLSGMGKAFRLMCKHTHNDYPVTVYYAFKQTERDDDDNGDTAFASSGWETMLEGLISAGFRITGTWPMRTEMINRPVSLDTNALASSIVLVCRPRNEDAPMATRREFISELHRELPPALKKLQQGSIAPVDFAQAAIGPGMAVFSRYSKVLEADGTQMSVRTALQIINQEIDAFFAEQEGDLDPDTRFCVAWFEQYGMEEGIFGEADVLARAKNTSVEGMVRSGIVEATMGKVRLLRREEYPEYPSEWNPIDDSRLSIWKCMQHLISQLERGGEPAAAELANQLGGGRSGEAHSLAYRLYTICERKGWAQEAFAYNSLVASWSGVQATSANLPSRGVQNELSL